MPICTSKEAPRFEGAASGLDHYIEDIELLCADHQKLGDAELIRWAIYYTDEKSSDTWTATRDVINNPKTWEDFKKAIQDIYPEAQPNRRHTISALCAITDHFQAQGVNAETVLAEYFREFSSTTNYLVSKHRMTKRKASILFISAFPREFRADITTRLTIKCPDIRPDDGYDLKDMDSAAQFVISSRPAIALLAATTLPTPMPPPPVPVATYTPTPPPPTPTATPYALPLTPPATYAAQPYMPCPPFTGCRFCSAPEHITPACQVRDKYAWLGKIRLNAGQAQMLDGADPFDLPYRYHSQFIKDHVDRWHLEHLTPTPPVVASANLLAATNSTESYAAKQKKNTTAMLKSKQTLPTVNSPAAAASGSKGKDKEKDIPTYKFRSPIDDITAP
jgi:hypothetical protein